MRFHPRASVLPAAFAVLLLLPFPVAQAVEAAQPYIHIVFLAGPKDHGSAGRHEYEADLRVLKKALADAPSIPEVRTSFRVGKAAPASAIADASGIVILSTSDRAANEINPLFPPDPSTDHGRYDYATRAFLQGYDDMARRKGMGVVVLHHAVWAENWAAREICLNRNGGLWVQMILRNPVDRSPRQLAGRA